ncbi:hypothetical protein KKE60_05115 [Patescibacteria group bacterium]|nr:hypothetical protein [Patescibacteria group bacterium]
MKRILADIAWWFGVYWHRTPWWKMAHAFRMFTLAVDLVQKPWKLNNDESMSFYLDAGAWLAKRPRVRERFAKECERFAVALSGSSDEWQKDCMRIAYQWEFADEAWWQDICRRAGLTNPRYLAATNEESI